VTSKRIEILKKLNFFLINIQGEQHIYISSNLLFTEKKTETNLLGNMLFTWHTNNTLSPSHLLHVKLVNGYLLFLACKKDHGSTARKAP